MTFFREPDYGFADCQQSVTQADREADAPTGGFGWEADVIADDLRAS